MWRITYDTGALLAAERRRLDMWGFHERALKSGTQPAVPTVVLAQAWRGGPQSLLSRLLRGCEILAFDENGARAAGRVCGACGISDFVDATVVVGALERGDLVVTSDPDDLRHIADALDKRAELKLHTI